MRLVTRSVFGIVAGLAVPVSALLSSGCGRGSSPSGAAEFAGSGGSAGAEAGGTGGFGASGGESGSSASGGESGSSASAGTGASGTTGGGILVEGCEGTGESNDPGVPPSCTIECPEGTACFAEVDPSTCLVLCGVDDTNPIDSQAGLDDLVSGDCEAISGSLEVFGEEFQDLAGLESLRAIGGTLALNGLTNLVDLNALGSLELIRGDLMVTNSRALESLTGLEALRTVGGLVLQDNAALSSIAALSGAQFGVAQVTIYRNPVLASLVGLAGVTRATFLRVADNQRLESLTGLEGVIAVGNLSIGGNAMLGASVLPSLKDVRTSLYFTNHESPTEFALPELTNVGCSLVVASNLGLTSLDLSSLVSVPLVNISDNPALASLGDMSSLKDVRSLVITGNTQLPQCQADALSKAIGHCDVCVNNDEDATCEP